MKMYVKSIGKCQQCLISLVLILLEGLWLLSMSVVADHHGSRDMQIMLFFLPIMLCSYARAPALLCPRKCLLCSKSCPLCFKLLMTSSDFYTLLPARASEQGNVIGSVSVYIYIYIFIYIYIYVIKIFL